MTKNNTISLLKAAGFCVLLLFASCRNEGRRYLIPEKKFIPFLVDLHIAEAIGTQSKSSVDQVYEIDSASLYGSVFQKHNVNQRMFDSTMLFYSRKPEKFKKIYDKVSTRLQSIEQALLDEEKRQETANTKVLWKSDSAMVFRQGGDKAEISIPLKGPGIYTVTATVKMMPDDASLDPRMSLYFWAKDSTEEGRMLRFTDTRYTLRTGKERTYKSFRRMANTEYTHLRGYIANYSNADSIFRRNIVIKEIVVTKQLEPEK